VLRSSEIKTFCSKICPAVGRPLLPKFLKAGQIRAGLIRAKRFGRNKKNGQF